MPKTGKTYSVREAAEQIGVAPVTLRRWLLSGKVAEVARDRNGWRVFKESDILRIQRYASQVVRPKTT